MPIALLDRLPIAFAVSGGIPENLLPVVLGGMMLGALGIGIAFVAIITDAKTEKSRHELIRVALEKDQPIPPALISRRDREKTPADDRRTGIILLAVSVGIFVFFGQLGLGPLRYVSAITGCLGIAFLLLSWLGKHPAANPSDVKTARS